jgi:predicted ATPase
LSKVITAFNDSKESSHYNIGGNSVIIINSDCFRKWQSLNGRNIVIGLLTRFRIEGLHNIYTFDIPIVENKLVLVGENGTGKSTVANFIYFFLTRQWSRMLDYQFRSVLAVIDGKEFQVSRDEIDDYTTIDSRLTRRLSPRMVREIERMLTEQSLENVPESRKEAIEYLRSTGLPSIAVDYFLHLSDEDSAFTKFKDIEKQLIEITNAQTLYLPTYRRIEQELSAILPKHFLTELERRHEYERIQYQIARSIESNYEELVQFGMDDVEQIILHKMNQIKDKVRTDLNKLTGVHLRDVIQRAYQKVDPRKIISLDEATIRDIFSRTQEILFERDQKELQEIIEKIKTSKDVDNEDKVVAHFLIQLIELYEKQQEDERDVREFIEVCNAYFSEEKRFIYDNQNFEMYIRQQLKEDNSRKIEMKMLSSGEKQVVSLFSHIYLSGQKDYFVIIDEPELSISVLWQKRLLPDILKKCNGLIAVTHSPFIFDNELKRYAHSLEEFTEIFEYDFDSEDHEFLDVDEIPF